MGYAKDNTVFGVRPLLFLCVLLLMAGCTHSIELKALSRDDTIARTEYSLYLYSSGTGDTFRTAFVKNPGNPVDVIPYSMQIVMTRGSFQNALSFMEEKKGMRKVLIQKVMYRDSLAGYLFTYDVHPVFRQADSITADIFEKNGSLYFSVTEQVQSAD